MVEGGMGQGTVCGKMEVAVAMTQYMFACVVVSGAGDNEHCIVLCGRRRVCKKEQMVWLCIGETEHLHTEGRKRRNCYGCDSIDFFWVL